MEKLNASDIIIRIGLDQKSIPKKIEWMAQDDPDSKDFTESKAVLVSLFDKLILSIKQQITRNSPMT